MVATKKKNYIYIICFAKLDEAPKTPFVAKALLKSSSNFWQTEYGPVIKAACATKTFIKKDTADKACIIFEQILTKAKAEKS